MSIITTLHHPQNSNYVFVDTTSRTASEAVNLHEVSRDFLDGVVYSAIVPQESVKGNLYTHVHVHINLESSA